MGRSRFPSADEDASQRSRRKKNANSGENLEPASAGQGTSEGKRPLYHCNYCNKDITGKIRIKCAMCPDFDLCIECFSVGAEVTPHKSNHPYRVMETKHLKLNLAFCHRHYVKMKIFLIKDNLSFPLICHDWNADDEILLLEGMEMYGMGNWAEVAEHVGTKSKEICIEHYKNVYLSSSYFPLPDMSHVVGKNRKELLAMAKGHGEDKKGFSSAVEHNVKEESRFSPSRVKVEEGQLGAVSGRLLSTTLYSDSQPIRKSKGKKPELAGNDGLVELSGYNPKRQEFDPEYDNDAEQLLAEMEFKDTDIDEERELKLRVLRIYFKRLAERKRRKEFILERNLLYVSAFERDLSSEERTLCRQYDVFMRFHSKEEHEELLRTVIEEHRTLKRIQELKEAQSAGCRTSAEADLYLEQKRKREADDSSQRVEVSVQVDTSNQDGSDGLMASEHLGKDTGSRLARPGSSSYANEFSLMCFCETQLLSEPEKRLCCEIRLPPPLYLHVQEMMTKEIFSGNISKKTDAHPLFKLESNKIDRVYDMLVKKGIAQQ